MRPFFKIANALNKKGANSETIFKALGYCHFSINTRIMKRKRTKEKSNHWQSFIKKGILKISCLKIRQYNHNIIKVHLHKIRRKMSDHLLTKHQFSLCIYRFFIFLLDNFTRVDLKNRGFHTSGSVSLKVVQSLLTAMTWV